MTRQGRCLDATEAPVNILDRLEGLSKVVPPEVMEQALSETGMSGQRSCKLSHRVMLWIVLAMGLLTHLPIRQVFKHAHTNAAQRGSCAPAPSVSVFACSTQYPGSSKSGSPKDSQHLADRHINHQAHQIDNHPGSRARCRSTRLAATRRAAWRHRESTTPRRRQSPEWSTTAQCLHPPGGASNASHILLAR